MYKDINRIAFPTACSIDKVRASVRASVRVRVSVRVNVP